MHPVDSNEISFRLAGRHAFSEAFRKANPKILEPIYDVEVLVPDEDMGDVMGDLQTRRAMIMGMDADSGFQKIKSQSAIEGNAALFYCSEFHYRWTGHFHNEFCRL